MNDPGDLRLETAPPGEEVPAGELEEGTLVTLYSNRYDCTFTVCLDHLQDEIGGHLVRDPDHPMFGPGDHLHFERVHVLDTGG